MVLFEKGYLGVEVHNLIQVASIELRMINTHIFFIGCEIIFLFFF